jgi:hypothetical protein
VLPIVAGIALDRILTAVTARRVLMSRALALLVAGSLLFEAPWAAAAALAERLSLVSPAVVHDSARMRACLQELPQLRNLPKGVILGPLDLGAHILFLTDHAIVSAGYHRNVEGIVAGIESFAGSEAALRKFVKRDRADYVALCMPWIDAHPERYGAFAKAMARGEPGPAWLSPMSLGTQALKLWHVDR